MADRAVVRKRPCARSAITVAASKRRSSAEWGVFRQISMRMQASRASSAVLSLEPIAGSAVVETASGVVQVVRRDTAQAVGLQGAVALLAIGMATVPVERASARRACEALVYQWTVAG